MWLLAVEWMERSPCCIILNGEVVTFSLNSQRAITSKLSDRVIGEVEVEQRGRQDGEDRSRRLGRRFHRTAVTTLEA